MLLPVLSFAQTNIHESNGNVGIGITSPDSKFHVYSGRVKLGNTGTGFASGLGIYAGSDATNGYVWMDFTNANVFTIQGGNSSDYASTPIVLQNQGGNVGIGTTSPTRTLDVIGSPIFQSANMNASVRMKPSSASFNGGNQVVDFCENYEITNSAIGVIGLANTNWAAPLPSFAVVSTRNGAGSTKDMMFWVNDNPSGSNVALTIKANTGNIGIGTVDPLGYKLAVKGDVLCTKVKVISINNWPDYVFNCDYKLRPLSEVAQYIQQHHHLPEVPSAADVEKDGVDLGDNQAMLLKKIEELTLYLIEQNKRIEKLEAANEQLRLENQTIKSNLKK